MTDAPRLSRWLWRPAGAVLLKGALPLIDRRVPESVKPFTRPEMLKPYHGSRRVAWTHYGVFVPLLPEPLRYLNTMTFIGPTGTVMFDNDYLAAPDVRNTATVLSSTAAPGHHHYAAYDAGVDCDFATDGSHLAWGEDLVIDNHYPEFHLAGRYAAMTVELRITTTDKVSWFVRNPVYDHLSLLAWCEGTITDATGVTPISAPCTVEYARCASPQALTAHPLPLGWKLPADFFTYQIVQLDENTQLLLTDVRADGVSAARIGYLRTFDGPAEVFPDVDFDVVDYVDEPLVDHLGRSMRMPRTLRWRVREATGRTVIELTGRPGATWRYGHGRGYVGAYHYTGEWNGRAISGSAYLEWVDCRPSG